MDLSKARGAAFLVGLLVAVAVPASAQATIYWANSVPAPESIGSANNDGSGVNSQAVPAAEPACDVAALGDFVYYTYGSGDGYVGRGNLLNGTANNQFIATADDLPCGVAVNSTHIFFNNYASGAIARANLNGTAVNQSFVAGGVNPQHPFVTDDRLYWTNKGFGCPPGCTVGRADLDGDNIEQLFIDTNTSPSGVAVNSTHVFWGGDSAIGRSDINGLGADSSFIDLPHGACDVAVDDTYIYWTDYGDPGSGDPGYIGRAKLNGTEVDNQFIETAGYTCGLFVTGDGGGGGGGFTITSELRITCAGTCRVVEVRITFDAAGNLVAQQIIDRASRAEPGADSAAKKKKKLIKPVNKAVPAGESTVKLKLTKAGKKKLAKKGKLKVKMGFTFTPEGGDPTTQTQTLKIKKKKK